MLSAKTFAGWILGITVTLSSASCAPIDAPAPEAKAPSSTRQEPAKSMAEKVLARDSDPLRVRIEAAIDNVRSRDMLTTHGFWTVFHALLGLGHSLELHDPDSKRSVNALDYIASGGEIRGMRFLPTKDGLDVQIGPQYV